VVVGGDGGCGADVVVVVGENPWWTRCMRRRTFWWGLPCYQGCSDIDYLEDCSRTSLLGLILEKC